jgi:DNA-directed RNA polymerase subunit RPC12/RpoP
MEEIEKEDFQDRTLTCLDCGKEFVFSAGEALYYWQRNLISPPKRCPECRRRRKVTIAGYWKVGNG